MAANHFSNCDWFCVIDTKLYYSWPNLVCWIGSTAFISNITPYLSVLDFLKSLFHEIDFFTWLFNLIFTACVACKAQVRNRQKIKLNNQVKKSISWNRDFKKSSTDR